MSVRKVATVMVVRFDIEDGRRRWSVGANGGSDEGEEKKV